MLIEFEISSWGKASKGLMMLIGEEGLHYPRPMFEARLQSLVLGLTEFCTVSLLKQNRTTV